MLLFEIKPAQIHALDIMVLINPKYDVYKFYFILKTLTPEDVEYTDYDYELDVGFKVKQFVVLTSDGKLSKLIDEFYDASLWTLLRYSYDEI